MSIKNILKLLILCIVLASSIGIASAAPPGLPMGLYGDIQIGGSPAPKDTIIVGKVGDTTVATTKVLNSGKYGDNGNYLGISAPNEGDNVDLYVNGVFVTAVTYTSGKSTGVDLNAPESSTSGGGTSGSSEGSVGGSGDVIKPTTTAPQSAVNSAPGVTATKENMVAANAATSTSEPAFNFYTILGVFAVLVVIGIMLKKSGKI